MSLIPSESHSFPDDFSRSISHARVKDEVKAVRAAVKPQPRKARAVPIPAAPAAPIARPMPRTAPVQEPRLVSNVRGPKPFGPVRSTKRVDVDLAPKQKQTAATQIEMPLGDEIALASPQIRSRRRRKWARFLVIEFFAIAVLVPSAMAALSHYFSNPALILTMNLSTIVSAIIAAIVPIIFFAIPPTLPRN
jgi:hypothetical protein